MNVKLFRSARAGEFAALVGDVEQVRVRFRRSETKNQWRCDACGVHRFATCLHERTALAEWRRTQQEVSR